MQQYDAVTRELHDLRFRQIAMALPDGNHPGFSMWARSHEIEAALDQQKTLIRALKVEFHQDLGQVDACWFLYQHCFKSWTPLVARHHMQARIHPFRDTLRFSLPLYTRDRPYTDWIDLPRWSADEKEERHFLLGIKSWKAHGQLSELLSRYSGTFTTSTAPGHWRDHIAKECAPSLNNDNRAWDLLLTCARTLRGFRNSYWTPSTATAIVLGILTQWEAHIRSNPSNPSEQE